MLDQLQRRFEHVHVVRTSAECAGVRIAYAKPEKFGVDRFLALLAAAKAQRPVLVVGGGEVALRKIALLRRAGACVSVVAKKLHPVWAPH